MAKFNELPVEVQERLKNEQLNLCNCSFNNSYEILIYNQSGTRFFRAKRYQNSWQDNKGNYMPFGGGSQWIIKYGCMGFIYKKQIMGYDYELTYGTCYNKSKNGTIIPNSVKTKKEVIEIIKSIGIFNI